MKKPSAILSTLLGLAVLLVTLVVVVFALAGTPGGTRLLTDLVREASLGALDWRELEGSLLSDLQVRALQLQLPTVDLQIDTLSLSWRWAALLSGEVEVTCLHLDGVAVRLAGKQETREDARPLHPDEIPLPLDFTLADLRIRDLQLQADQELIAEIEEISAAVRSNGRQITLQKLTLMAPQGALSGQGNIVLDERLPISLAFDWNGSLLNDQPVGGRLELRGDASQLRVEHAGRGEPTVNLRGELKDLLGNPGWNLELNWPEIRLAAESEPLVLAAGTLSSHGQADAYSLNAASGVQLAGVGDIDWSLEAVGGQSGLQLESARLAAPQGVMEVRGAVQWLDSETVDLQYELVPDLLTLERDHDIPAGLVLEGSLQANRHGDVVRIEQLSIGPAATPAELSLSGNVNLAAPATPRLDLRMRWRDLQWPVTGPAPQVISAVGALTVKGEPDAYTLALAADLSGSEIPSSDWVGTGSGSLDGLQVDKLQGSLLDGVLSLDGRVDWNQALHWRLKAQAEQINPGVLLPDLPGRLHLNLETAGHIDPLTGPVLTLRLNSLAGQVADREIALAALVEPNDRGMMLTSLELTSADNVMDVRGQLTPALALEWHARIPAPQQLLASAQGQLQASGRIDGNPDALRVAARMQASDLVYDDLALTRLNLVLQAGAVGSDPLQLRLHLEELQQDGQAVLDSMSINASGSTHDHWIKTELRGPADNVIAHATGGWLPAESGWTGVLDSLQVESASYGNWQLERAAAMTATGGEFALEQACLQASGNAASLCAGGGWVAGDGVQLNGRLQAIALSRLLPNLTGALNGTLLASLGGDGELRMRSIIDISPGALQLRGDNTVEQIPHNGGALDIAIDEGGLHTQLSLNNGDRQLIAATLQLPALNRLPITQPQPLAGRIQAKLDDLSGLQALLPELDATAGRLTADMQLAGTLQQPRLDGELRLAQGRANIPLAGLALSDITLRARGDPAHPGELLLSGGLRSGPGHIALDGRIGLSGDLAEIALSGTQFEVYNTEDGRVLASPELELGWQQQLLTLRGRVFIPEARLTPKLGLTPSMVAEDPAAEAQPGTVVLASPDVVVIDEAGELIAPPTVAPPVRIDSELAVIMGEDVKINALGLAGRIVGALAFTNTPQQADLIPITNGRLGIEDGTFRAFGQDLEIETGRLLYDNAPLTEPNLLLRGVRWIDNDPQITAAGVAISGSLDKPNLELFSRPQLDPTEVQSYLLTGRSAGDRDTVLSIGTYLHPKIYVGYGFNLLEETSEFNALYTITPRYGVGANVGEADNNINLTFTLER